MTVVAVVGIVLPLLGGIAVIPLRRVPAWMPAPRAVVRLACAGAGAAWAVLLVTGGTTAGSWLVVDELVAAAGCGTVLLAAALAPAERSAVARTAAIAALAAAVPALAVAPAGPRAAAAAWVGVAAVAVRACMHEGVPLRSVALLGAGAVAVVSGLAFVDGPLASGTAVEPAALAGLAAGVAVVAVAAAVRPLAAVVVALPAVLALVLAAAPLAARRSLSPLDLGAVDATALGLAVLATVLAASSRRQAGSPLGAWHAWAASSIAVWAASIAAAGVPGSRLLGAAALLAFAMRTPAALVLAVPGAAAAASGLVLEGGPAAVGLGVLAATSVGLLSLSRPARRPARGPARARPLVAAGRRPPAVPERDPAWLVSAALGSWVLAAPGTWGWAAGPPGVYGPGLGVVVAAGLVTAAAGARSGGLTLPDAAMLRALLLPARAEAARGATSSRWRTAVALAPLGVAVVVLVASSVRPG